LIIFQKIREREVNWKRFKLKRVLFLGLRRVGKPVNQMEGKGLVAREDI
jgi:hypothetical protein